MTIEQTLNESMEIINNTFTNLRFADYDNDFEIYYNKLKNIIIDKAMLEREYYLIKENELGE